jgi:hypothetical protein
VTRVCLHSFFRAPVLLLGLIGLGIAMISACGGGSSTLPSPPPAPAITSVVVSPGSANLFVKATQQFTANVQGTGSFNSAVTWYVNDVQGGNAIVGTISATGLYAAPPAVPNPTSVSIKAQSVQDNTKSGSSAATINPEKVQVSISPASGSVQLGATLQFSATVTGTANNAVLWSVNNFVGGQPGIGLIDQAGLYTAPANLPANTVTVSVVSQEDTTKAAVATVTILATAGGITVTVSPQNPNVVFDGSQSIQFSATVTGTSNTSVTWSVDPFYGSIGQISSGGLFTPSTFNCGNVPAPGLIRAVSAGNPGAQGVSKVNLVPPAPTITALSPQPADARTVVQTSGAFAVGATFTALYPGPNGTTIPGTISTATQNAVSGPVPLGAASGALFIQQSCVSGETGMQYPLQQSNSLPFRRLPRLRVRANRQVLTPGESTQMLAAFMGDPTPQPITWSALFGSVTLNGVFTAGASNWDKVTGCISGTQQCDFFVFSIVPARIEPTAPVVPTGGTLQLSQVPSSPSPSWTIEAGGGSLSSAGLYTAPIALQDSGAIPINTGSATNAISVAGAFPGMVNRLIDYPDISANATGQTTLPRDLTVDGNRVYVLSDNLPTISAGGHYKWIDAYDASDPAHPVWTGAVEGFDPDLRETFVQYMQTFASGGFLWRVTTPSINGNPTELPEVAFFDVSSGQPVLKQFYTTPELCADTFYQGLLVGIPCLFTSTGQSLWQPPVNAVVFDGRTGTIVPSQAVLALPNPTTPASVIGIGATGTRIFLLFTQQQSDGSQPLFLSTYDFTASPPSLLQTVSAQAAPVFVPGQSDVQIHGSTLFAGGGVYDISSGLPVLLTQTQSVLPSDMNGSLALLGPLAGYRIDDYSSPTHPKPTGLLFNGDTFQGPSRFVGNHAYVLGSGVQIFDLSAPNGGPIPAGSLQGKGALGVINDLLVDSSVLYSAENTDVGAFVTSYDLTQTPPLRMGSFALSTEIPFALAAAGLYVFVGTSTELLVLDVTSPASPAKVGSLALPTSSLAMGGNMLYAGTTDNHLVVIDITNPASPVTGTPMSLAGFPVTMQAQGNLLFIAADTAGLLTYSIANPLAPALLSQFRPSSALEGVAIDGNLTLLAAADGGLVIANMANPAAPALAGQVPIDTLACFADTANGPPGLVSISLSNGIAYVGSTNLFGAIFGFDYRQAAHPRVVSASSYGDAILETVSVFAFSGANMFVGGDLNKDQVFEADNTQPRNFIRHMCLPPFGNASTPFPEVKISPSALSKWNPKTHRANGRSLHP